MLTAVWSMELCGAARPCAVCCCCCSLDCYNPNDPSAAQHQPAPVGGAAPGRCSGHRPGVTCVCMQTVAAATQLGPCVPVTGHVSPSDACHTHCRLRAQPPRRHTQDAWCSVLQSSDSDGIKVKTTKFWFNCSNTAQASHSTDRALSLTAAAPSTRVSSILISASLVGHWAGARAVPCPVFMKY